MLNAELVRLPTAAIRHTTHLFDSLETAPFDVRAYSRMKFGCGDSARILGTEMADAFAAEHWELLASERTVVIPAPSTTVPVAATLMGWHFHNRLNVLLDRSGLPPVEWNLIHRAVTYNDSYASLSLEERRRLLSDDSRYVNVEFLSGKALVFVDDVRITGTHEEKLSYMLDERGLHGTTVFATYAAYSGQDPSIEHRLNHCEVRDGLCVAKLSRARGWSVTTRGLRLLLESDAETFAKILETMEISRLEEFYEGSIVKGYNTHEPYADNMESLRAHLRQRSRWW